MNKNTQSDGIANVTAIRGISKKIKRPEKTKSFIVSEK